MTAGLSSAKRAKELAPARQFAMAQWDKDPALEAQQVQDLWDTVANNRAAPHIGVFRKWRCRWRKKHNLIPSAKAGDSAPSQEVIEEFILRAIEQSHKVPLLEAQNYELRNKLAATKDQLKILEEDAKRANEKQLRYRQALQQGDIKPSL